MNRLACLVLFAVLCSATAAAQIYQWNAAIEQQSPLPYQINQDNRTVTITAPATDPNQVFSFEAYDSNGNPVDIDRIEVGSGVTGLIRVQVVRDPQSSRTHGAHSIRVIDLSNAGTGELVSLKLTGGLGQIGSLGGFIDIDTITASVQAGALLGPFDAASVSATSQVDFSYISASAACSIDSNSGSIKIGDVYGQLTVDSLLIRT
ncbi:MAG: hypothetical protein HZB38_18685 [Planctomycetes bacterium]|nr:hypothetical protein [Planctomycetota bacterium]